MSRNKGKGTIDSGYEPDAQLYLLDEPIGGVDPAARDYILIPLLKLQ